MKTMFTVFFFLLSLSLQTQKKQGFLKNKKFIANVGYISEETPGPDPCAGKQIYLVLAFKGEKVHIEEKYISSCDKTSTIDIGNYPWKLLGDNEVKIYVSPQKIKGTYVEKLRLTLNGKQLLGSRKDWNNNLVEYTFDDHFEEE